MERQLDKEGVITMRPGYISEEDTQSDMDTNENHCQEKDVAPPHTETDSGREDIRGFMRDVFGTLQVVMSELRSLKDQRQRKHGKDPPGMYAQTTQ